MRVCLINYTPYGTQGNTNLRKLSQSLARQGIEVSVIALQKENEEAKHTIRQEKGVKVHELPIDQNVHSTSVLSFCKKSSEIIADNDFDVVHIFSFRCASLIPLISLRTSMLSDMTWVYQLVQVSFNTHPVSYSLSNKLLGVESKLFDKVITSNDEIFNEVYGNRSANNRYILPLGVNMNRFERSASYREQYRSKLGIENEVLLASVGSMNSERGLELFIRGFAMASEEIDSDLHLLFIGDGKDKDKLIRESKSLGIFENTTFLGKIPFEDVPKYLSAADIGVSHISSTTPQRVQPPLKVSEYLASGLPVLATKTSGNEVYVENGYNGFLYEEELNQISAAIRRAVTDGQWKVMREDCIHSIQEYDIEILAEDLINIYYK